MADKHTPYDAPWVANIRHRPDPNRVEQLPWMVTGSGPALAAAPPVGKTTNVRAPTAGPSPRSDGQEPSYYDVSPLKRPVWKWQIATYFFLGGLSAGAYLLARLADRFGLRRHRKLAKRGTWLALATIAPCPLLLIDDLGDPKRFHHMLRVFKPASPMNLGTWMVTGYSGAVTAAAIREVLRDRHKAPEDQPGALGKAAQAWLAAHDAAGIPLAIGVAGYTGVLLSCTANPLWCKNPWLGPMFSASALATGAEALSLALDLTTKDDECVDAQQVLTQVDTAAHAIEGTCAAGFQRFAAGKGAALRRGSVGKVHHFALGALAAAEVLKRLPVQGRLRKPLRMLSMATGLAAGFAMRWAQVYGGKEAAADPHTARLVSRPDSRANRSGGQLSMSAQR